MRVPRHVQRLMTGVLMHSTLICISATWNHSQVQRPGWRDALSTLGQGGRGDLAHADDGGNLGRMGRRLSSKQSVWQQQNLPIREIMPEILESVRDKPSVIIQAPTGAGKTTMVPLAVLESGLVEGRILVLQPRRITCITVARRIAQLLGEEVGETVGFRIRHETTAGPNTKLEVITEGILGRMLSSDSSLEGVGAIFFDEFHERSLESDVSFALCLHAQRIQNLSTKLIIMSATLGDLAKRVAGVLREPKVIYSEGRTFPVDVEYHGLINLYSPPREPRDLAEIVAGMVKEALEKHEGDILVFLPGEREINWSWIVLNNMGFGDGEIPSNLHGWFRREVNQGAADPSKRVQVVQIYGGLDHSVQDAALQPPEPGWRKVILASPIAEASITVPGIRVVVDSGLHRVKLHHQSSCTSRMITVPISRASAEQRKGRAGRVSTGVCYRLWGEEQNKHLPADSAPEIQRADLAPTVLHLAVNGFSTDEQIYELPWLDAPPGHSMDEGRHLLRRLQALEKGSDGNLSLTERGRRMAKFPAHPRIAHMIVQASAFSSNLERDACDLAALLSEREILRGGRKEVGADLEQRMAALQSGSSPAIIQGVRKRVLEASDQLRKVAAEQPIASGSRQGKLDDMHLSVLIAWAYPELVAERLKRQPRARKGKSGVHYRLAQGIPVTIDQYDSLAMYEHLVVASVSDDKVFWAVQTKPDVLASYGIDIADPKHHKIFTQQHTETSQVQEELQQAVATLYPEHGAETPHIETSQVQEELPQVQLVASLYPEHGLEIINGRGAGRGRGRSNGGNGSGRGRGRGREQLSVAVAAKVAAAIAVSHDEAMVGAADFSGGFIPRAYPTRGLRSLVSSPRSRWVPSSPLLSSRPGATPWRRALHHLLPRRAPTAARVIPSSL